MAHKAFSIGLLWEPVSHSAFNVKEQGFTPNWEECSPECQMGANFERINLWTLLALTVRVLMQYKTRHFPHQSSFKAIHYPYKHKLSIYPNPVLLIPNTDREDCLLLCTHFPSKILIFKNPSVQILWHKNRTLLVYLKECCAVKKRKGIWGPVQRREYPSCTKLGDVYPQNKWMLWSGLAIVYCQTSPASPCVTP